MRALWGTLSANVCRVYAEVLAFMEAEARKHLPNETGGILLGRCSPDDTLVVKAGDGGPNAAHTPSGFRRDGEHAQQLRDWTVATSDGRDDYVGEWHSHPLDVEASPTDRHSMRAISSDPEFAIAEPVLIVLRQNAQRQWHPTGYRVRRGRFRRMELQVEGDRPRSPPLRPIERRS